MQASDIDAWGGGNPKEDLTVDLDFNIAMNDEAYKAWVKAGKPQKNGIKNPELHLSTDEQGYHVIEGNVEGLMALTEVIEELFKAATFGRTHETDDMLTCGPTLHLSNGMKFGVKIHIKDANLQRARLAKVWVHNIRDNAMIVEHTDNP